MSGVWSGCPVRQEIVDSSTAIAYGDGLEKALEGQEAMFYVDSRGQRGDLAVHVDGLQSAIISWNSTTQTDGQTHDDGIYRAKHSVAR